MWYFQKVSNITTDELQVKRDDNPELNIIDVRVPERYKKGHIPNVPNIPYKLIKKGGYRPSEKTYVICHPGVDSKKTCKRLSAQGYDVVNVLGGMLDWHGETIK